MSVDDDAISTAAYLEEARERGLKHPVVLSGQYSCAEAQAVFPAATGRPLSGEPGSGDEACFDEVLVEARDAAGLLRSAGPGGKWASRLLGAAEAEIWRFEIEAGLVAYHAFRGGLCVASGEFYQDALQAAEASREPPHPDEATYLHLARDGALHALPVRPDVEPFLASLLIDMATARRLQRLPLDEHCARHLGGCLGDHPAAVAMALTALRRQGQEGWLTGVLTGRPELSELASAVQRELAKLDSAGDVGRVSEKQGTAPEPEPPGPRGE